MEVLSWFYQKDQQCVCKEGPDSTDTTDKEKVKVQLRAMQDTYIITSYVVRASFSAAPALQAAIDTAKIAFAPSSPCTRNILFYI